MTHRRCRARLLGVVVSFEPHCRYAAPMSKDLWGYWPGGGGGLCYFLHFPTSRYSQYMASVLLACPFLQASPSWHDRDSHGFASAP